MSKKIHKLVISFNDKQVMLDFAARYLPKDVAVYHADALDKEFGGRVSPDTYVVRTKGAKPNPFLADHAFIGAEERDVVD